MHPKYLIVAVPTTTSSPNSIDIVN